MRRLSTVALLLLTLAGCSKRKPDENANRNPYHDVRPQKVKQDVERIQRQDEERNDKRLEELK